MRKVEVSENQLNNEKKVLSVQSHVVYGYVGNKSAVFPLQLLGFDVSSINSVQFSNHTGYKNGFKGEVLTGTQLDTLRQGLHSNNLLKHYDYLLTGYIGSKSFLEAILSLLSDLKKVNENVKYSCDPVLGDHGKLYVPEELIDIYISKLLPNVDTLTPNEFELEKLSQIEIKDFENVLEAFGKIHSKGVKKIFLTTTNFGDKSLYASIKTENGYKVYKASFPQVDGKFTGTGDLLSSLLLGWTSLLGNNVELALKNSLSSIQAVIKRTHDKNSDENELELIKSRFDIIQPPLNDSIRIELLK